MPAANATNWTSRANRGTKLATCWLDPRVVGPLGSLESHLQAAALWGVASYASTPVLHRPQITTPGSRPPPLLPLLESRRFGLVLPSSDECDH